jgi:hypothetical protein
MEFQEAAEALTGNDVPDERPIQSAAAGNRRSGVGVQNRCV